MAMLRYLVLILLSMLASEAEARHHKHNSSPNILHQADKVMMIDLPDIFLSSGQSFTRLTNLHCFIPLPFNLTNIDPDFSHMFLPVNASLGTLHLIGDYSIVYYLTPLYNYYGQIDLKLQNVSAKGTAAIALMPAVMFALQMELDYNMTTASATVVPLIQNALVTEAEMTLSHVILEDSLMQTIKKEIIAHLDYLILLQINAALGKMSVFTVGQHKIGEGLESLPDEGNQKVSLEELVDVLLENVRSRVKDEIDIPNFRKNFTEKLESKLINGTFHAESGWIAGLSTLKRASNVSLSKEVRALHLSVNIGFDVLEMGYDHFLVKLPKEEFVGELRGDFLYRMMTVTLKLEASETDTTCKVQLKDLQSYKTNGYTLEKMDDFSKDFDWLKRRMNIWLIGHFHSHAAKQLQKEIGNAIKGLLYQLDCGEYIPLVK